MGASSIGLECRPRTIHGMFYDIAERHPERIAVRDGSRDVSYAAVAEDSRHIARHLIARGVGPGHIVPVMSRRGARLPAVLLGVLATGAAYGMLDTRWPRRRLEHLLSRMAAPLVIADLSARDGLASTDVPVLMVDDLLYAPQGDPPPSVPVPVPVDSCATVFWTSGSTGAPKAVLSPHEATTRLFDTPPFLDFGPAPVMIHAAAVAWDAFSLEIWGMLLLGGTLLVHSADVLLPGDLRSYIREFGATHLFLTPALADVLIDGDIDCLAGLDCLMVGGDKPTPATCQKILGAYPEMALLNGYGPVESCVFATTHRIMMDDAHAARPIPAGDPVPGTGVHIVANGQVLQCGETGEIALSGNGLAIGYLNEPELTREAFGTIDIDGEPQRVYLTGDHGRIDEDGKLHFAGRRDAQVKVSGHRIEPAEIEAAARAAGSPRAVVMVLPDEAGTRRLILFVEQAKTEFTEEWLRAELKEALPAYMVPTMAHVVPKIPLLENTKIDKKALAAQCGYTA